MCQTVFFSCYVDEAPKNRIATYFLHIIEGLSLDLTLNQFLEFRRKTKNIDSICYSSIYKMEHPNEFKKTLTFQSRKKTILLLSHMNDNITVDDLDLVNFLLEFHIDSFLAFFMQRRPDKQFKKYDCRLTMLHPADVLLNGLEDKIYQIHEDDLAGLSSYHRAKKNPPYTFSSNWNNRI